MLTFPAGLPAYYVSNGDLLSKMSKGDFKLGHRDLIVYDEERIKKIIGKWKPVDFCFWKQKEGVFQKVSSSEAYKTECISPSDKKTTSTQLCTLELKK